jgi:hypothetical protein
MKYLNNYRRISVAIMAIVGITSLAGNLAEAVDIAPMAWTPRPKWINVKSPGIYTQETSTPNAVGDGCADDTAAIQGVLNWVSNVSGGSMGRRPTVYFPPGTYKITSTLTINRTHPATSATSCNMVGSGINTVIKWCGPSGGAMIWPNNDSACRFLGFVWDGNGNGSSASPGTQGAGCAFLEYSDNGSGSSNAYLTAIRHENESFRNFNVTTGTYLPGHPQPVSAIVSGFTDTHGSVPVGEITILNCRFYNCTNAIYNPVEIFNNFMWVVDGCEFDNNAVGFNGGSGADYALLNSHFDHNSLADIAGGVAIRGQRLTSFGSGQFLNSVATGMGFQDCWVDTWTNPSAAMELIDGGQASIVDCTFTNPPVGAWPPILTIANSTPTQLLLSNVVAPSFAPGEGVLNEMAGFPIVSFVPAGSLPGNVVSPTQTFLKSTYAYAGTAVLDVTNSCYNPTHVDPNSGDTSYDWTPSIQLAIDNARTANNGTVVYIPGGLYRVNSTLNLTGGNYILEGEGTTTLLLWYGADNSTMMSVTTPQNIVVRGFRIVALNATPSTFTALTETSTGASSAMYDGINCDSDSPEQGIVLNGLPTGSTVYIPELDSRLAVNDCGQAQIFSLKANIVSVKVSGATNPETGFLGLMVAEGGQQADTGYNFTVNDNQNLLVGPYYSEQCRNDLEMLGGSGTTPGHVAIDGYQAVPSPVSVSINVNNYTGRLFYTQQIFGGGGGYPEAAAQINQTGTNPFKLVLAQDFFIDVAPSISLGSGASLVGLLNADGLDGASVSSAYVPLSDSPSPLTTDDLQSVAQGFDDFRQLGALNLAVEYGQVNPSGLVAYWKLDEATGPAVDSSMSGITGTWQGSPTFSTNHPGSIPYVDAGCLSLNGSGQCVNLGNPAGLPSGHAPRTICGWGKANNTAGGWRWIAAYGSPSGSQAMFIGMNGTTLDGGAYGDDLTVPNFWDDKWHFIALTYDGTTANLYADGVLVASDARNWNLVPYRCYIGEQVNNASEYWNGYVDDVRIYNRALSAAEIGGLIATHDFPVYGTINPAPFSTPGYIPDGWTLTNALTAGSGVRNLTVTEGGSPFSNNDQSMLYVDSTASSTGDRLFAQENFAPTPGTSPAIETFDFRLNPNGPATDLWIWSLYNTWVYGPGIHIYGGGGIGANVGGMDHYLGGLQVGVWYRAQIVLGAPSAGASNATLYLTPWYGNGAGPTVSYTIDGIPFATSGGYSGMLMYTGTGPGAQQSISIDNMGVSADASLVIPPNTGTNGGLSAQGIVAEWKLDESTGPESFDSSGEFITGTWMGSPVFSTSKPPTITFADAGSLTFNGVNMSVAMGNPACLPIGTASRTICGWAKSPSGGLTGYGFIASYGSQATHEGFWIGGFGTSLWAGASFDDALPPVPGIWDGNWHFIALTYDGTTACLYADGVLKESAAKTWNLVPSVCYLGCYLNGGISWDGGIDDVRIYNRALSAAEVANLAAGNP